MNGIEKYLQEVRDTLDRLPLDQIQEVVDVLLSANIMGNTIFIAGNGGSAATASHMANDLAKGSIVPGRRRFRAIALTDNVPLMTAWGNDASYDEIFVQQLDNLMVRGDVLISISGSGNSPNVLRAVELARQRGGITVGLTGFEGGKLAEMVDVPVVVPNHCMEQIEDAHMVLCHLINTVLREQLNQAEPSVSLMFETSTTQSEPQSYRASQPNATWLKATSRRNGPIR